LETLEFSKIVANSSIIGGMELGLSGRVTLVTGAARGIGRAIPLAFAGEGVRLALTARSQRELEETGGEARRLGAEAVVFTEDLADRGTPARLAARVAEALGPVEILVNNAALVSAHAPAPVWRFDDGYWDASLAVNLTAPYLLSKAVLPGMMRNRWGRIVNIASTAARSGSAHGVAYAATKSGLLGLTRTFALDVAEFGITVNAVCPGPTRTEVNDLRLEYDVARLGRPLEELERSLTPMGRRVAVDEVAWTVLFLAGCRADATTGQAYHVDCGQWPV
jgi:NAD(P)-dependent dehydrogenase (short-subunit alcohol dehydrogenase family)